MDPLVLTVIILALGFDFLNGIHDSSNVVATMIFSRALPPKAALWMAAIAEFLGPFIFGVAVAETIGGIVEIGRGCWRGCAFCSPTMRTMRHRPLENILEDVQVNLQNGQRDILLHCEDFLGYGSKGMKPNEEKVLELIKSITE